MEGEQLTNSFRLYTLKKRIVGEAIEKSQLKYQSSEARQEWENEWMEIRLRYKEPDKDTSQKIVHTVTQKDITNNPSGNYIFASAVAEYGMLLRDSQYKGQASWNSVRDRASQAIGDDAEEYRGNFLKLVKSAEALSKSTK